ncbi:MAG TPA: hypothetical protein VHH33_07065, partial [Nitrososphaeraceae archaeon]|nr:hypothetical protein [Nitrososphaeraceae archaeon]
NTWYKLTTERSSRLKSDNSVLIPFRITDFPVNRLLMNIFPFTKYHFGFHFNIQIHKSWIVGTHDAIGSKIGF